MQGANDAPSRRHSKEATPEPPASLPEKAKLAEAALLSAGGLESMLVVGAAVSIDQLNDAGVWSTLPAAVDRADLELMGAVAQV